jgi:hypothetical protein
MCLVCWVNLQDLYVAVGMILPVLDGKFSADVDVNMAAGFVRLGVIRMRARITSNCYEPVSEQQSLPTRKRVQKLNDLIVNEQPVIHDFSLEPVSSR